MKALLIHGMGRTPLSMCILAIKLRSVGFKVSFFAYTATFERWERCAARLIRMMDGKITANDRYIVVAHSLGSVLARTVVAKTTHKPEACFFLTPPTLACQAANRLAPYFWYQLLTGEMGRLLADEAFMSSLPIPDVPTYIYSGNAGLTGNRSPFGNEPNDGILMVKETLLPGVQSQTVASLHTFIMNNRQIMKDIVEKCYSICEQF